MGIGRSRVRDLVNVEEDCAGNVCLVVLGAGIPVGGWQIPRCIHDADVGSADGRFVGSKLGNAVGVFVGKRVGEAEGQL